MQNQQQPEKSKYSYTQKAAFYEFRYSDKTNKTLFCRVL